MIILNGQWCGQWFKVKSSFVEWVGKNETSTGRKKMNKRRCDSNLDNVGEGVFAILH